MQANGLTRENRGGADERAGLDWTSLAAAAAVLVIFLGGLVFMTGRAISASRPADRELQDAGDEVMRRLGAVIGEAKSILPAPGHSAPECEMLADLDGDGGTGAWSRDGAGGLEKVKIRRVGTRSLAVEVFSEPGKLDRVVLTTLLDPSARPPFLLERSVPGDRLTVRLNLRKGDSAATAERSFNCAREVLR